ncbi:hypothetical protein [Bosea sp. RAC05]|uniref:hypothetical protein n=1 Tax=Bosea sp. RAC05 TaxID=1842539 RepID=UPI00083CB0B3|nr:hypothetical protein [Bosea sp. RAC05]AOG02973.1 hypothetical protein BSY19_5078 [Bosea sp. RAC05]
MTGQAQLHTLLADADRLAISRLIFEPRVSSLRSQISALQADLDAVLEERRTGDEAFEAIGRQIEVFGIDRDTLDKLVESRLALLSGIVSVPSTPGYVSPIAAGAAAAGSSASVVEKPVMAAVSPETAPPASVPPETPAVDAEASKPRQRRARPAAVVEVAPAAAISAAALDTEDRSGAAENGDPMDQGEVPDDVAPLADDREPALHEDVVAADQADSGEREESEPASDAAPDLKTEDDVLNPFDPAHAAASEVISAPAAKAEPDFVPSFGADPVATANVVKNEADFIPSFETPKSAGSGDDFLPPFLQGQG